MRNVIIYLLSISNLIYYGVINHHIIIILIYIL